LDQTVRIPMRGKVASLNAAVAGSVLLFAAAEQRGDAPLTPEAAGPGQGKSADESADLAAASAAGAGPHDPNMADDPNTAVEPVMADLLPDDSPAPEAEPKPA